MSNSFEIRSLAKISFDELFETHLRAFKDYPFQWSKEGLKKTIHRRGYDPSISFGAFYNNEMVSFTLNGIGTFNDLKTVYDTGTGTVEEYRGKGLASKIFDHSVPFLKKEGVQQYILEVLQENNKAFSVYAQQGFVVSRKFECFRIGTGDWKLGAANNRDITLKEIDFTYQPQMATMIDFNLSWQNNFPALTKKTGDFKLVGAFHQNKLVAYGIIEPDTGDIPQLAVDKNYRRKKIGTMLLNELKKINRAPTAKVVNVESNQEAIISFLTKNGFPKIVSQFEMIKAIQTDL
jgi:ribosomal protein S18 acetylase RimI-like enzyme